MSEARIHPPSQELLRVARRAGLAPRVQVVGIAAALAGLACLVPWLLGSAWSSLQALAQVQLTRPDGALPALPLLGDALWPCVVVPGLVLGLRYALGRILHGGAAGQGRGLRIARARPTTQLASVLAALGTLGLSLHTVQRVLQRSATLLSAFHELLVGLALWLLLCALLEAVLARLQLFRTLHLSHRELRDELRAVQGDPHVRAARAREAQRVRAPAS
jgi:hypothetical protein